MGQAENQDVRLTLNCRGPRRGWQQYPCWLPWRKKGPQSPAKKGRAHPATENPDITGELQQRFSFYLLPTSRDLELASCSQFSWYSAPLSHHMDHPLPSLVICCSAISCSRDFSCASGFLFTKRRLPSRRCLLATCGVWFSFCWVSSISGWKFQSPNKSQSPHSPGSSVPKRVLQEIFSFINNSVR